MAMVASEIERLIRARIPDAEVTIRDLAGDGDHYAATVIAESFRGKSRVQQHQIVHDALKGQMAVICTRWRCRPERRRAERYRGSVAFPVWPSWWNYVASNAPGTLHSLP